MSTYGILLALHISAVLAAFFLSGALHISQSLMTSAGSVAEARALARPARLAPAFGPIVIAIFVLGGALLQQDEGSGYHFSDGWVWSAVVALAVLAIDGPLVLARYDKRLEAALDAAPEGPVPAEVRALTTATVPWVVGWANTFLALAVVLNMSSKPGTGTAVAVVLVGAGLGAALGLVLSRR